MDIETYLSAEYTTQDPQIIKASKKELKAVRFEIAQICSVSGGEDLSQLPSYAFYALLKEIAEWVEDNCQGKYQTIRGQWFYAFELESDAILFKLRWN